MEVSKSTRHRAMDPVSELYWEHALAARITAPSSESGSLVVFGVGGSNGKFEILQ